MQQNLNLVFNKHYLRIFRTAENSIHILHEEPIDSKASFFRENLKEVIRKNHQNPEKINLWYSPVKYTLLPSTIFLPSKLENYFELNFGKPAREESLYYESIIPLNIVVVYAIPSWLLELKSEISIFGDINSVITKQLLSIERDKALDIVECAIYNGYMDVYVKSKGNLVLANHYEILNENDLVYFLLLIKTKLNLNDQFMLNVKNIDSEISNEKIKSLVVSIEDFKLVNLNFADNQTFYNSILCE